MAVTTDPKTFYIASFPRSGNTLLRLLLLHYFRIPSWGYRNAPLRDVDLAVKQEEKACGALDHRFIGLKTHEASGQQDIPSILVVRHPVSAAVSYAHYLTRRQDSENRVDDEKILSAANRSPSWSEMIHFWGKIRSGPRAVIKYETLVDVLQIGPSPTVTILQTLLKTVFPNDVFQPRNEGQPFPTFEALQERHGNYSFRAGKKFSLDCGSSMDAYQKIVAQHRGYMEAFGYPIIPPHG